MGYAGRGLPGIPRKAPLPNPRRATQQAIRTPLGKSGCFAATALRNAAPAASTRLTWLLELLRLARQPLSIIHININNIYIYIYIFMYIRRSMYVFVNILHACTHMYVLMYAYMVRGMWGLVVARGLLLCLLQRLLLGDLLLALVEEEVLPLDRDRNRRP